MFGYPSEKCAKLFRHEAPLRVHFTRHFNIHKRSRRRLAQRGHEGPSRNLLTQFCAPGPGPEETHYWHGYLATIRKWHQPRKLCQFTRAGVNYQANSWADNSKLNVFTPEPDLAKKWPCVELRTKCYIVTSPGGIIWSSGLVRGGMILVLTLLRNHWRLMLMYRFSL